MSTRRLLLTLMTVTVTVLALLGTAGTAAAHTGAAPATPSNQSAGGHTWGSDGCSTPGAGIDRIPGVFDFEHACIHHDGCYQGLDRNGVAAGTSRFRCDSLFLADMRASCTEQHGTATTKAAKRCRDSANLYYGAVRIFGGSAYTGSGSRF